MKKPRELDMLMAKEVLGHNIKYEKDGSVREDMPNGQSRPLRPYSIDISAAWELVKKLGMTLIPVENGWFVLVGPHQGWKSPAEFLTYLQTADFSNSGAAVGEYAPMTICLAAMKSLERKVNAENEINAEETGVVASELQMEATHLTQLHS